MGILVDSGWKAADTIAAVKEFLKIQDSRLEYISSGVFEVLEFVKDIAANEMHGPDDIKILINDVQEARDGIKKASEKEKSRRQGNQS